MKERKMFCCFLKKLFNMDLESLYYVFSIIGVLITIAALIIAIIQIKKMNESNRLSQLIALDNYSRTKIKNTIDDYNRITRETQRLIDDIIIRKINVSVGKIKIDYKLHYRIRRYISLMCRFSIGIESGIYDLKTFDRMHGLTTLEMYNALKPYIDYISKEKGKIFYGGYLGLIRKITVLRAERQENHYIGELEKYPTFIEDAFEIYSKDMEKYIRNKKSKL